MCHQILCPYQNNLKLSKYFHPNNFNVSLPDKCCDSLSVVSNGPVGLSYADIMGSYEFDMVDTNGYPFFKGPLDMYLFNQQLSDGTKIWMVSFLEFSFDFQTCLILIMDTIK